MNATRVGRPAATGCAGWKPTIWNVFAGAIVGVAGPDDEHPATTSAAQDSRRTRRIRRQDHDAHGVVSTDRRRYPESAVRSASHL